MVYIFKAEILYYNVLMYTYMIDKFFFVFYVTDRSSRTVYNSLNVKIFADKSVKELS